MLKIRAHHLLCIPRYYSGGYDKTFAKMHKKVCRAIRKNPEQKIKILRKVDDLCAKCPHRKGQICIMDSGSQENVMAHDTRVIKRLKIKENSIHKAKEIFNLSMSKIPNVRIMCDDCDMYYNSCTGGRNHTGINNSFKEDLNKQ